MYAVVMTLPVKAANNIAPTTASAIIRTVLDSTGRHDVRASEMDALDVAIERADS